MTTDHRGDQRGLLPLRLRGLRASRQLWGSALAPCSHGHAAAEKKKTRRREGGREGGEWGVLTCCPPQPCSPAPQHTRLLPGLRGEVPSNETGGREKSPGQDEAKATAPSVLGGTGSPWEPPPASAGAPSARSTHSQQHGRGSTKAAHLAPGRDTPSRLSPPTQHPAQPEGSFCGEQLEEGGAEAGGARAA